MKWNLFIPMLQYNGTVITVYLTIKNAQSAYELIIDDVIPRDIFRIEGPDVIGEVDAIVAVDVVQRKNDFRIAVLPSRIENRIAQMDLWQGGNAFHIFFVRFKDILLQLIRFFVLFQQLGEIPLNLQRIDAVREKVLRLLRYSRLFAFRRMIVQILLHQSHISSLESCQFIMLAYHKVISNRASKQAFMSAVPISFPSWTPRFEVRLT